MEPSSITEWFFNIQQGPPGSIFTTFKLSESLNNPQNSFKSIHVAGTNGKGSVTTKIAKVLQGSGYRVGIFTSPHIFTFTERIQVDFQEITEETFFNHLKVIRKIAENEGLALGWFDIYTVVSFLYFRDCQVDFACVEVGVGGLLDNTNIINPVLSVIVSIGFDHMNILGSTLEEITENKAGIIKNNVPCVFGPSVLEDVVRRTCDEKRSLPVQVKGKAEYQTYDMENQEICKVALKVLVDMNLVRNDLKIELLNSRPLFRLQEFLVNGKQVILDVSHNSSGVSRMLSDIRFLYPLKKIDCLFAVMKGKEFEESIKILRNFCERLFFCSGNSLKLMKTDEILSNSPVVPDRSGPVVSILNDLIEDQSKNLILVTGSFYIMSDAWQLLTSLNKN
jgi:dihydrofolate synthase/folylpolyglutamate synthase